MYMGEKSEKIGKIKRMSETSKEEAIQNITGLRNQIKNNPNSPLIKNWKVWIQDWTNFLKKTK